MMSRPRGSSSSVSNWTISPGTIAVVDPVLGDHGRAYRTCTPEMCRGMVELAGLRRAPRGQGGEIRGQPGRLRKGAPPHQRAGEHAGEEIPPARPRWADGTPAHTVKKFGVVNRYDLRREFPIMTLRRSGSRR